ncbi:MAG: nicotinamide riboside transporter PnuC [Pseudomonadota bacterium]
MNDPIPLLGFTTNAPELLAFILSVTMVILNIRQSHWAWLFAIAASATYGFVYFDARLYGDTGLQLVFIVVSLWGWYQWLLADVKHVAFVPSWLTKKEWLYYLAGWASAFSALSLFLKYFTNTDVPFADAFLTAGSLVGTLLLSRKKIENWIVWIVVDLLYIGMYVFKNLILTAILFAVFVVLAAIGLRAWQLSARAAKS